MRKQILSSYGVGFVVAAAFSTAATGAAKASPALIIPWTMLLALLIGGHSLVNVRSKLSGGAKMSVLVVAPVLAALFLGFATAVAGHQTAATLMLQAYIAAVMLAVVLWIVFVDSKERWPGDGPFQRFTNLFTFKR